VVSRGLCIHTLVVFYMYARRYKLREFVCDTRSRCPNDNCGLSNGAAANIVGCALRVQGLDRKVKSGVLFVGMNRHDVTGRSIGAVEKAWLHHHRFGVPTVEVTVCDLYSQNIIAIVPLRDAFVYFFSRLWKSIQPRPCSRLALG